MKISNIKNCCIKSCCNKSAYKYYLSALILLIAACSSTTELQYSNTFTSIKLPHEDSGPTTLSIADDGDIWFTLSSRNAIGRVEADGSQYREYFIPSDNSSPRIIALGSDGNMWFSEHSGNRIGRITPDGVITEFNIPTPNSQPRAITLGSDGNIWFGEFAGGKIGRITPEGIITEFDIPSKNSGPRALAAGLDGNIWFSEFNIGKIGRISPEGEIKEFDLLRPNSGPGDITAGTDGAMWFVELSGTMDGIKVDGNRIGRISMAGAVSEFLIPSETGTPINITVGPDLNIWYSKGHSLGRVTPDGKITEFSVTNSNTARIVGLTAGSDRALPNRLIQRLWFTDPLNNRIAYLHFDIKNLKHP